jgi:hypothetical protein
MLLWPRLVCGGTAVPRSSPGPRLPKPYGCQPLAALGALLVSPFNVRWRFSAPAGGVEGSKLCLFSVIMPAKCVSSISPRFHCRRVTFCFLPLATILEFSTILLLENQYNKNLVVIINIFLISTVFFYKVFVRKKDAEKKKRLQPLQTRPCFISQ